MNRTLPTAATSARSSHSAPTQEPTPGPEASPNEFEQAAAAPPRTGLIVELWDFLRETRAWCLAPVVVVLLLIGLIALLSSSAAAPFIYTLF